MVRLLVVGAGAVGAYYAALLSKKYGSEILLLARNESYKAIDANGVVLKNSERQEIIKVQVTANPSTISNVDYIMLAVKMYDLEVTLRQLAGLLKNAKGVFGLENGIEKEEIIRKFTSTPPMYGTSYVSSEKLSPGVISHLPEIPRVVLGEMNNAKSNRILEISDMFRRSGIDCIIPENIMSEIWMKFVKACAINGICAAARCNTAAAIKYEPTRKLITSALEEGLQVAGAYLGGISAEGKTAILTLREVRQGERPSTMVDAIKGRRTEVEFLNGALVRKARAKNLQVPVNEAIYAIISAPKDS